MDQKVTFIPKRKDVKNYFEFKHGPFSRFFYETCRFPWVKEIHPDGRNLIRKIIKLETEQCKDYVWCDIRVTRGFLRKMLVPDY